MTRLLIVVVFLVGCGAGQLQPEVPFACGETLNDLPNGTVCQVCNGVRYARVYGGADGWCDFDGASCACHGHGVGDQCQQAVADFHGACYAAEGR